MVINNPYYIDTNQKPIEVVCEIKNEKEYQVPSYEEFMKNYNEKEEVNDNYRNEFDSYGDLRVKGSYYGPGFWDDIKGVVKPIATGALVVASVFPPTAPIGVAITLGVGGAGLVTKGVGHLADNDDLKEVGMDLVDIANDTVALQGGEHEAVSKVNKLR